MDPSPNKLHQLLNQHHFIIQWGNIWMKYIKIYQICMYELKLTKYYNLLNTKINKIEIK